MNRRPVPWGALSPCSRLRRAAGGITILLALALGCADGFDRALAVDKATPALLALSQVQAYQAPVPGNGGLLIITGTTANSLQFQWMRAASPYYSQTVLQYKVVRSDSNNISTVSEAQANGTLVQDWTTDLDTVTVGSLSSGTTYYVNVLVRDPRQVMAAYVRTSASTL